MRVTVVGTGVGGLAIAGHAGLRGLEVVVQDVREDAVESVVERGGIEVRGKEEGFAPVLLATTDIGSAIEGADLIIVATQGQDQRAAAAAMAEHLRGGQTILVKPGCTFGAVEVRAVLDLAEVDDGVDVAEADSFVFGCSTPAPAVSMIASVKQRFGVAALPADRSQQVMDVVKSVFEQADAAMSVLHTGLANMNAILHVAPMVLNAGRIEDQGAFDFYGGGITPAVSRVVQAMDDERMAVAQTLAVEVPTLPQWAASTYGPQADDIYQLIQVLHRDVYGPLPAPATLHHRYLSEDVPCGAVPICELGRQIGVPTPATAACVSLVDTLLGTSWMREGRTMERLGLSGLSAVDLQNRLAG